MANKENPELVEQQGVNEGTGAEPAATDAPAPDVLRGGDVSQAPDRRQALAGYPGQKIDEQAAGEAPPHRKDGVSGQDAGLMD
ncbi:hypothetical protein LWF15_17045 [Kineosporia rhizophila]|uniref:hypothetical protein n=1 Tax=Kineosporia TaxID=49184 RepID=UPI001E62E716|nr:MULTISPECIES: hypothetical protein [Kineosporia]MCE0537211.1 hypothetical protein [Kineosporia rhizophila]